MRDMSPRSNPSSTTLRDPSPRGAAAGAPAPQQRKVKLSLDHMTKLYANGDGVRDISFEVYEGELVTMLGPSGCGKSTILRTIGGFIPVTEGDIRIDGESIKDLPPEDRPTSMVFQSYNLWPHMTVYKNLAFGLKLRRTPKAEIERQIKDVLKLVKMEGMEEKYPDKLSGGQQQRIAIARSLLLKPAVLLLDEPFSALDAKIRQEMRHELKQIQRDTGITIIFVTHDQAEAMTLSDRIIVMNKGIIEQIDTPETIYDEPASRFVASFIGEMNFLPKDDGSGEIAVRPENLKLRPVADPEATYRATLVSKVLIGNHVEVMLNLDGQQVFVDADRATAGLYEVGEVVGLSIERALHFAG